MSQRPAAFIVAIPLIIVLSLAVIGSVAQSPAPLVACGDETMQGQIRGAMFSGLDTAFTAHVGELYLVWLKDTDGGQSRAKAGIDNAVGAYLQGYKSIAAWRLPPC